MTAHREIVEPGWCTGAHVDSQTLPLHRSPVITVGPQPIRDGDGVASIWLKRGPKGPPTLGLLVAYMATAEISLSMEDARLFHRMLGQMLERADQG